MTAAAAHRPAGPAGGAAAASSSRIAQSPASSALGAPSTTSTISPRCWLLSRLRPAPPAPPAAAQHGFEALGQLSRQHCQTLGAEHTPHIRQGLLAAGGALRRTPACGLGARSSSASRRRCAPGGKKALEHEPVGRQPGDTERRREGAGPGTGDTAIPARGRGAPAGSRDRRSGGVPASEISATAPPCDARDAGSAPGRLAVVVVGHHRRVDAEMCSSRALCRVSSAATRSTAC